MNNKHKTLMLWIFLVFGVVIVFHLRHQELTVTNQELSFSELLSKIEQQEVQEITLKEGIFTGLFKGASSTSGRFRVQGPKEVDSAMIQKIRDSGAKVD